MWVRACEGHLGAKGARKELEESCQDASLNRDELQNLPKKNDFLNPKNSYMVKMNPKAIV